MRTGDRIATSLLAVALCVPGAWAPLRAQVPRHGDDPGSAHRAPNLVVPQRRVFHLHRPDGPAAVRLTAVEADVRIVEQVATTTLRISLANDGHVRQEAQLLVPVPVGAVVRGFELEGLGEEGIARILPLDEARRIYDDIVRRIRDPGLLEFVGCNLVRSSVFPVPPHGAQSVRLIYEQVLPSSAGRVDYVLPRSETLAAGGVAWSIDVEIRSKSPIATVYSPTHEIETERRSGGRVRVVLSRASVRDAGPFHLSFLVGSGRSGALPATLLAYPDPTLGRGEGGYFLFLAGLPAGRPADRAPVRREVIVVLDRSGSMRGAKIDQAREAALQVIEALDDGEAFNIIDYATSVESFSPEPVIKSARTMAAAREYLDGIRANGGTAIHDALIEALRQPTRERMFPVVLFLTDGLPTVGVRGEVDIREAAKGANRHGRRIFTFGVGFDVNAPLLSSLALASRGKSTFVLPEEDVEVKVGDVFRGLSGPTLASPELVALDSAGRRTTRLVREVMPAVLPDLFAGDQLVVLGQYTREGPLRLRLSGEYYGEHREFTFDLETRSATTRNGFVPRLWASRKIAELIDEIRAMGAGGGGVRFSRIGRDDPRFRELVEEIVRLSTRWGILTEYTAFLAKEEPDGTPIAGRPGPVEWSADALRIGAEEERAGSPAAVSHEKNLRRMRDRTDVGDLDVFLDAELKKVETGRVLQVGDRTFYRRAGRWVEAALLDRAATTPDKVVEFGTPEFDALARRLAEEGRQGILAVGGEVYLLIDGESVLIRTPSP